MIQAMNERYRKHIITLEDPVEYTLCSSKCLIEQREHGQRGQNEQPSPPNLFAGQQGDPFAVLDHIQ